MPRWEKTSAPAAAVLLCVSALYLCVNLFASLRVPILLGGDQAYFWMRAMRILDGQRIYRDFLQYTPPGTDLLFAGLFKLFGVRMWVTNLVVFALGLAFVWLVFSIAHRFMRVEYAVLAAAIFLVPIYGKALNATHHWFGVFAALAAVRAILNGTTALRVAAAGAILGVGSYFSTYHGLAGLLALSVFLLWVQNRTRTGWAKAVREQVVLFGSYLIALALLYRHYLLSGGTVAELWYFQVTCVRDFAMEAYRGVQGVFPLQLTLHNLPAILDYLIVYLLLTAGTAAALSICWRRRRQRGSVEPAVLVALLAMFLFAEVAVSPNWLRIYAVSAPAVILLAWVIGQMPRSRRCVSSVLWVWIILHGSHQIKVHREMPRARVDLPAGRVATTPQMADSLRVMLQFVKPGDVLFQPAWPGVYVPLHLRNRLSFDTANNSDMPRPDDMRIAVGQLQQRGVSYILWPGGLDSSCPQPCSDRLAPMREAVHAAYAPVATLPDGDTLWRRTE